MLTDYVNMEHMENAIVAHVARSDRSRIDADICSWKGPALML